VSTSSKFPTTLSAAIDAVAAEMSQEDKARIAAMSEDDLVNTFDGLVTWIRASLGLTEGNPALVEATGASGPDGASMVIIDALWRRLWGYPEDTTRPLSAPGGRTGGAR
jgi:hypothetical protein